MRSFVSSILCGFLATSASAQISFTPLGDLPGGEVRSRATAISGNGLVVVGASSSTLATSLDEAFRWTVEEGLVGLGALSDRSGLTSSAAFDVSHDGSVVVGRTKPQDTEAFRWTAEDGMVPLGLLPGDPVGAGSIAWGTSADGNVVVGQSGLLNKAFRWTMTEGMVPLGGPPGETVKYSSARDVSADGVVIVGDIDATGFGSQTYRWTSETGMVPLGGRSASAVSADGSVVVGLGGPDAFRWTAQSGRIGLGDLPGGDFRSFANDVSADGSVIVGFGTTEIGDEAMFWTQETGMVNLRSFLTSQGLDLAGWTLTSVEGVSADGRTVVGSGVNPAGNQEAWIATIPEPSTIILALLAGAALLGTYLRELLRQRRALVAD